MSLSDLQIRQAKATGKDYTLADSDGLSLAVTANGGKSWHFRYHWMKVPKRMSLRSAGRTQATRYFIDPQLLRGLDFSASTTLKRIEPHRWRRYWSPP